MKFVIEIKMDNAAFDTHEPTEVVRILRGLADRIEAVGDMEHALLDINGNRVGESIVVRFNRRRQS